MLDDDAVARALDRVMPRRLHELSSTTGLPVVFGGTTRTVRDGLQLTINQLIGTFGDSLRLLSVLSGRGLGGAAMARRIPCRVSDYASTPGITHDYDHVVVENERLASILAYPIIVHGSVRGVVYGAMREHRPIGDVAVRNAGIVAATIARDATALLDQHSPPTVAVVADAESRAGALLELAALIESTDDPELRTRLSRIHDGLAGARPAPGRTGGEAPALSPREIEALQHVAVGATNAEIAAQLGITVGTVKAYLHSAMRKLDAQNRARAVIAARSAGLI
ncbi:putative transcriptional regulator [Pseudonocardia sp. Ae406_Ps2]|uniref:helix-turn-helix transcriptional regulator n=1 Tax=unclassified Pseudonocardia TaxID=2619320 RepID=UPI00095C8AA5|nr:MULTISPECIES: LuxR C-terminal-related transcriptional regulator [unclassified Pseudonocardia]OLL99192.1 putative transcriptional regulator [Pseudonocardia sp. Ae331_Ps2]OLM03068.1 putative transcriptional regulator [Pseudonocardia sp. Ae406_Ps2]OLM12065.1 putative transcriptional regulator [Pseudonocardia sp. Ae505_Ps2]OLM24623.1 putative transcriptional regulator [Pseudonocardia sp. Ae706_Ps2]OLM29439.1 putative transcriptional regulator [Pseudonocardia sp. Ae717_Ps2]